MKFVKQAALTSGSPGICMHAQSLQRFSEGQLGFKLLFIIFITYIEGLKHVAHAVSKGNQILGLIRMNE